MLLEKLLVKRVLGEGAMGVVFEVEHLITRHRRALKVLKPDSLKDAQGYERFLREASVAGRTGSEHIVETYDAGRLEDGSPYLLMEQLEGETLADWVYRGPLSPGAAAYVLIQVCEGIHAAHLKGIVHRDLKPANIFIERRKNVPFAKVLDFGLAKVDLGPDSTAMRLTGSGVTMGTPLYMAPEQMRGARDVDGRADVYSLGVIFYECIVGRPPYESESFAELAAQVLAMGYQAPSATGSFSRAIDELVKSALEVDPAKRLPSAEALAAKLRPLAREDEAIAAVRSDDGLGSTVKRPSAAPPRRRPGLEVLLAVVAIAAIGAVTWMSRRPDAASLSPPAPTPAVVTAPIPAAVPVEPPAAVVAFEAAPPLQPPPAPPLVEAPAPGVTRPQHRPAGAGKPKPRLDAGANIYDQMR